MHMKSWLSTTAAAAILSLTACTRPAPGPETRFQGTTPDASVVMTEVQAAYLASVGGGRGTLTYRGVAYPFNIAGAGVGGIGASTIDAVGDVYNMPAITTFPGAYAQGRYGFAIGSMSSGEMWLQNEAGVVMHLKAKREGLMLSLGADAMMISMAK